MKSYRVVWEGRVREVYYVEAESEQEAMEKWSDEEPLVTESLDGAVVSVEEDEED